MIKIIGAGMAGLLAGNILRDCNVEILEQANELPNNHSAVLRFRSSIVGDTLNIPFEKVTAMKAVHSWKNPIADNLAYSVKCTGTATLRSIVTAEPTLVERFIAPDTMVQLMAEKIEDRIIYNSQFDKKDFGGTIISTIPMPTLMRILDYKPMPDFITVNGINLNVRMNAVSAFASLYVPDPDIPFSRLSLTGDRLTIELPAPNSTLREVQAGAMVMQDNPVETDRMIEKACELLGVEANYHIDVSVSVQRYAKILPINEEARRRFIIHATRNFNIFSLGRYAVWRPGLLLDDLVNDVRVIARLIDGASDYDHQKK